MVERFTLNLYIIFSLAKMFTHFLRGFRCLAFFELSTGSVHYAPDEIDRPSEQTVALFCFSHSMLFLNYFFGELTEIRA